MKEVWTIIKREYRESVFKKSFIILTLLMPILMVGIGLVPSLLIMLDTEEPVKVNVIDESSIVFDKLITVLNDTLNDGSAKFIIEKIPASAASDSVIKFQKTLVESDAIDGLLVIPKDILDKNVLDYYTKNVANFNINYRIKDAVQD